jgi:hypothetical protein
MQLCENGHENADEQRFCGECGVSLEAGPTTDAGTETAQTVGSEETAAATAVPPNEPPADVPSDAVEGVTAAGPSAVPPPPPPERPADTEAEEPNKKSRRKLWWGVAAAVVVIVIVAAIAGASGNDSKNSGTQSGAISGGTKTTDTTTDTTPSFTEPTTTLPAGPQTFPMGFKVTYDSGASVQVFSWQQPVAPSNEFETPPAGQEFGVADVQFCSGATTSATYNPLGLKAQTPDNRVYTLSFAPAMDPQLGSGDVPAGGGCVRGFVTLALPAGQQPSLLIWDYPGWAQAQWKVG